MRRRGVAGLLALAALGLVAAPLPALAADPPGVRIDRTVTDPRITESSGLAVSPTHPGVLWTHDDSGNPPVLYALGPSGGVVGTVRLTGVPDVDWEAMAAFRDPEGRSWLAAADIGDNDARRSSVEVDVVPEPSRLGPATERPALRLRLRYPDGPRDAETLLVDPSRRRMFVVSKGLLSGTVYAVPTGAWDGTVPESSAQRSATLVAVGTVPLMLVTDGAVAAGGAVLLRTYGDLAAFDPFPTDGGTRPLLPRATAALPAQQQGEGLALEPGAASVLLSSEGTGQPVLRLALPGAMASLGALPARPATPSRRSSAAPSETAPAGSAGSPGSLIRTGAFTGGALAGLAAVTALLTAAVVTLRRRR